MKPRISMLLVLETYLKVAETCSSTTRRYASLWKAYFPRPAQSSNAFDANNRVMNSPSIAPLNMHVPKVIPNKSLNRKQVFISCFPTTLRRWLENIQVVQFAQHVQALCQRRFWFCLWNQRSDQLHQMFNVPRKMMKTSKVATLKKRNAPKVKKLLMNLSVWMIFRQRPILQIEKRLLNSFQWIEIKSGNNGPRTNTFFVFHQFLEITSPTANFLVT